MILENVKMIGSESPVNIRINGGRIAEISPDPIIDKEAGLHLTFDSALAFPGLINSHDHLDFNLFPQLGDRIYNNYTEWGGHIHKNYKKEIDAILKIPVQLRSRWGVFKNLLCGVTTVVNHGEKSGLKDDLITIFEDTHCLHSVQFEKNWKRKLNNPLKRNLPVNIHVGEGSNQAASNEIDELIKWNLLRKKLIGVHAVAMNENQAKEFEGIVWCPESNCFLLDKTAPVDTLKKHTEILFGTDSTLTGSWDIWGHLRLARKTGLLTDKELYETLNRNPANTWQLNSGGIAIGKDADLFIGKINHSGDSYNSFFDQSPADLLLVVHQGNVLLFDESLLTQLKVVNLDSFSKVYIDDACKYVPGDLPGLMEEIKFYNSSVNFPISINFPVIYE